MGIWSLLFPSEEDRLRKARALMAQGRFADARKGLIHCKSDEAEKLYDECSKAVDKGERAGMKKALAAEGFHGWKVAVTMTNARRKAELEKLIADELAKAGVDLALPQVDQEEVQKAVARAQRRMRKQGADSGSVKLVPMVDPGSPAERAARGQAQ